jgi:hypothetical protein
MNDPDDGMRVLAICNPLTLSYRLGAILDGPAFSLTSVTNTEDAETLTGEKAFDLILIEYPTVGRPASDYLKGLRWSGSPCQRAIVIALAGPDILDEAEEVLEENVSRILNPEAPEHILRAAFEEVGNIDKRYALSAFLRIPGEELGLKGTLMTQTMNVSSSGMMVRLTKEVSIGARFSFALTLPGMTKAIEGKADAIRLKTIGTDRIQGFAATFAEFSADGQQRLEDFLKKQKPTH